MDYKKIKTFPAVLKAQGMTEEDLVTIQSLYDKIANKLPLAQRADYVKHKMAEFKLELAIKTVNGGWSPNLCDTNTPRWYNWWEIISNKNSAFSGRGLSLVVVFFGSGGIATVAPCLLFESRERAAHAAKFFLKLYEEYYLGAYNK